MNYYFTGILNCLAYVMLALFCRDLHILEMSILIMVLILVVTGDLAYQSNKETQNQEL